MSLNLVCKKCYMKYICSDQWSKLSLSTYTVLHINRQVLFGAENQGDHQIFEKSLLSYKFGLIFIGMKQKKNFFFEK